MAVKLWSATGRPRSDGLEFVHENILRLARRRCLGRGAAAVCLHRTSTNGGTYADFYPNTHSYSHTNSNEYAHSHACADFHTYAHADRHPSPCTQPNTHFNTDCYSDPHCNSDCRANARPDCYTYTNATIIRECRGHRYRVPGWVSRGVPMQEGGCYLP